ncbi:hypothetical protein LINPERHAP1_LOCUS43410, partial [Linum perenne]
QLRFLSSIIVSFPDHRRTRFRLSKSVTAIVSSYSISVVVPCLSSVLICLSSDKVCCCMLREQKKGSIMAMQLVEIQPKELKFTCEFHDFKAGPILLF